MRAAPWVMAARPRTLGLSVTPVAVGTALAWAIERRVRWLAALAALIGGVSLQIGTNLHNVFGVGAVCGMEASAVLLLAGVVEG